VGYEITVMVGYGRLRDLNDSRFWWVTRCQCWLDLLGYEISMTIGFGGLRGLSDGRFWWLTRSQ